MNAHARLSPSSAHRFFPCPGSVRLSADIPRSSSRYASEGTAAHDLAARCLRNGDDALAHLGNTITADDVPFEVTEEMCRAVQVYLDVVRRYVARGYALEVEVKLDLGHLWPGTFGTGDAVLYREVFPDLVVIDYKHGAGVSVDPTGNPQLLAYGSGANRRYGMHEDAGVTLIVVQPRAGGTPIKEWRAPEARLDEFKDEFERAAARAMTPDAPLQAGQWCRFCPATHLCPALRAHVHTSALIEFNINATPVAVEPAVLPKPVELTDAQLGCILDNAELLEEFCEAVKTEGLRRVRAGAHIPGWKAVEKRTLRKWKDEDAALAALTLVHELSEDELVKRKLISPAQVEKLIGKSRAETITSLVTKPIGDPTLAPGTDPRAALPVAAAQEFGHALLLNQLKQSALPSSDQ